MEDGTPDGENVTSATVDDLAGICRLLNDAGVDYLVYGGLACIIHGHARMTLDVDICLGEDRENISRALRALESWGQGFSRELTVDDLIESVVVRIGDKITLDLSTRLWKTEWAVAWARRRTVQAHGVSIPVLCRQDLISSKRTHRERDAWDVSVLLDSTLPEPGEPAARE